MKKQFASVVHSSAMEQEKIWVSGGRIGLQICLAPADLLKANGGKSEGIIKA
jgi:Cys-tRNA(Pro)/Cys-tRNA(Cys) deacylase